MDEIISQPEKTSETGESRSSEKQSLDEATFEPRAHVERTGSYKQSEAVQAAFETVTPKGDTGGTKVQQKDGAADVGATPLPIPKPEGEGKASGAGPDASDKNSKVYGDEPKSHGPGRPSAEEQLAVAQDKSLAGQQPGASEGPFEKASDESGGDGKDATQINLPDMQEAAERGTTAPIEGGKVATDPLTGKSIGDQGGKSAGETESPVALEPQAEEPGPDGTFEAQAPKIDDEGNGQLQVSTGKVGMEDGEMQTIPGPGKLIPDLPKDRKGFIGEGTHGMLDGSGPGEVHSGPIKGYGPGYKEGPHSTKVPGNDFADKSMPGSSSPKSGPPVHGYGPGMVGETTRYEGEKANKHSESSFYQKFESEAGGSCSSVANYKTGELTLTCKTKEGDTHIYHWGNTVDGGSPIPYTGSGGWGERPQPQVIGGLDEDSGHFNAVVSVGGKTVGGSGSSEPGTEGDEGHWYGGIFASAARPNNPDDPDYYTPNVLGEAIKAKKISKSGG